jgi:putative DNA primase/helicase
MIDLTDQFKEALQARGLIPPVELLADGQIHRCHAEGCGGENDGSYLLHLDGIPAGGFENWRDGAGWENWRADIGRTLTPEEVAAHRTHTEAMRKAREEEDKRRKAEARERAKRIWDSALPCTEHPYLTRKGIRVQGARIVSTGQREGDLLLPIRDAEGKLHSLQFIGQDGGKLFLPGGRKRACYFGIGKPAGVLYIAEGFATAASIHEATGQAVAIAFDAGNLQPVAEALRTKYPSLDLVLAADDDYRTDGNPGLTKAKEAAVAIGARVAIPDFGTDRPERATDFNDLHHLRGLAAVKACLAGAISPTINQGIVCPVVSGFEWGLKGLYSLKDGRGNNEEGKPKPPERTWIAPPFTLPGLVRDLDSMGWRLLIAWHDLDGRAHEEAVAFDILSGEGAELAKILAHGGMVLPPDPGSRKSLLRYLCSATPKLKHRVRLVDTLGWQEGAFVLPGGQTIGRTIEPVRFTGETPGLSARGTHGTLEGWQVGVAQYAIGNPRLAFGLASAFAGPLLALVRPDGGGGFNLQGSSSKGKSTILEAAASVWGRPDPLPTWRATSNGLEGIAATRNDGFLVLDELGQVDSKEAGQVAYMLANGSAKARMAKDGGSRLLKQWRLIFLSSGEQGLEDKLGEEGKRTKAGQEVRVPDIPCRRTSC